MMSVIRPVNHDDLPGLMALAGKTGGGLTSLPQDERTLSERIERSLKTWRGECPPAHQGYVFVLEQPESREIAGICAVEVAVGLEEPWYNYRVGSQVHASRQLEVYNHLATLSLSNDHTGASELCTLFLDPARRENKNGQLLSKSRLLFMANFPHCFSPRVVAEMRGVSDEQERSPFWDSVGRHFFSMEFSRADFLSGTGHKAFIAELMPKHPLYVHYLTPEAREVIGQVHPHTAPARSMLEAEGFRYRNYVDIFDGGPTLECDLNEIRSIRESRLTAVTFEKSNADGPLCLVANQDYHNFRAMLLPADPTAESVSLTAAQAEYLKTDAGEMLRIVSLSAKENSNDSND